MGKESKGLQKHCITTVVSGNKYQDFIPLFVYSINRYYPEVDIHIFIKGSLNKKVKDQIKDMSCKIHDKCFEEYIDLPSMSNSLRFLVPSSIFMGYTSTYITDIDFIFFRQEKPYYKYFMDVVLKSGQPYAAVAGAPRFPKRPHVTPSWSGKFLRTAAGSVLLTPEWFRKTKRARNIYREILRGERSEKIDNILPASYREYDEVMFCRLCREAGLKVPSGKKYTFLTGKSINSKYRHIHLGDFKFKKRYSSMSKMKRILHSKNVRQYDKMKEDPKWLELVKGSCDRIKDMVANLNKHVYKRLHK